MRIELKNYHFTELIRKGISLDMVFLMKNIDEGVSIDDMCINLDKIAAMRQALIRKSLITEDGLSITLDGKEVLVFLTSKEPKGLPKKEKTSYDTEFGIWWKSFPDKDTFDHGGKHFEGARTLRINEKRCREIFNEIISSRVYTAQEIIDATSMDILKKKNMSVRTNTNKLSYLQNSATYLYQKSFEPYIESVRSGEKVKPESRSDLSTDI